MVKVKFACNFYDGQVINREELYDLVFERLEWGYLRTTTFSWGCGRIVIVGNNVHCIYGCSGAMVEGPNWWWRDAQDVGWQ